jgi:hypothetical protein
MSEEAKTGDVAVRKETLPAVGYENYSNAGFEGTSREDFAIPFLGVLQKTSPQLETVEGAKVGQIFNTVTNTLYDGEKGISFVPALTQHVFVEWKPRDEGGGFVGIHNPDSDVVKNCKATQEFGEFKTAAGNDLVETFYVYGILVGDDTVEQAVIAFTSTKIKRYKAWLTKAKTVRMKTSDGKLIGLPLFAHKYRLRTIKEKNNFGDFYNFTVPDWDGGDAADARLATDSDVFQAAVAVNEAVLGGTAKAAHETQKAAGGDKASGDKMDQDIPF